MTDNQDDNRNSGLSFLIEGLKRSFQAIDQIIHQSVISLCVGNPTSPHFAITKPSLSITNPLICHIQPITKPTLAITNPFSPIQSPP